MRHYWFLLIKIFLLPIGQAQNSIFSNPAYNEATVDDFIQDDLFFEVTEPKDLHYSYRIRQARDFGSKFPREYKGVRLVLSDPLECCSLPYNSDMINGAVVLVLRGECSFVTKAVKAEKAGAFAIIIMDNQDDEELHIEMIHDQTNQQPKIPAAFLMGRSGFVIMKRLSKLKSSSATINIPVNMSSTAIHELNQPPWITW